MPSARMGSVRIVMWHVVGLISDVTDPDAENDFIVCLSCGGPTSRRYVSFFHEFAAMK